MKDKVIILKNGNGYKKGQLVESYVETKKGIVSGKNYIPKSDFVYLNEKLSRADEEEVRKMIKELLKKMFWRLYTRSSFIVSE
jgi:hypothetical protein